MFLNSIRIREVTALICDKYATDCMGRGGGTGGVAGAGGAGGHGGGVGGGGGGGCCGGVGGGGGGGVGGGGGCGGGGDDGGGGDGVTRGSTKVLWRTTTTVIVGSFAGQTWKNNKRWYN